MEDKDIKNLFDKIVAVPPIIKRIEALELTDPEIPGEIKIDKHGKLLKSWFEMESNIGSHIETYDNWIVNVISKQLANRKLIIQQGEVTVMNPMFYPPRISTSYNSWTVLTPKMARDNGYTYSAELYADLVLNRGTQQEEKLPTFLGKFPVMLGSILCHTRGKSDREKIELGECIKDPFGYFIIKGTEQVILIQEKLRVNKILLYNASSKGDVVCKITSNTISGSTNVVLVKNKTTEALEVHLAFMGRSSEGKSNKVGNTVSVFQIYRMLGISDPNEILKMISLFTKREYIKKIWVQLQPTFVRLAQIGDDIEYIAKNKGLGDLSYNIKKFEILKDLKNELFSHIPSNNIKQKLYMLSIMVARMTEYLIGVRKLDDRDNWGNKRLESAGRSLEQLFGNIWREIVVRAQDSIDTKNLQGLLSVKREIDPSFIADNFVSSFTANNWGVQGSYMPKENITDILKRDSITSVYSHITKVNTPTNRRAKQIKIRLVQMSQLGYICVTGDTDVMVNNNYSRKISDLEDGDTVTTVSPNDLKETPSRIKNHFKTIPDKLLELKTISGRIIKCTPDHPFLVKENGKHSWIKAGKLKIGDKVVVKHSLIPITVKNSTILHFKSEKVYEQYRPELQKIGLLDRNLTQEETEILARLLGASITDGHIHRRKGKEYYNASFYLGEETDAMDMSDDIMKLGFESPSIYRKVKYFDEKCTHRTWEVSKNGAFAYLMVMVGAFVGKKTAQLRKVPQWIINSNLKTKREFLNGFQGGDGGKITVHFNVKSWKVAITPTHQTTTHEYLQDTINYLHSIAMIFHEFKIRSKLNYNLVQNSDNYAVILSFEGDLNNICKYVDNITYAYCYEKRRKSSISIEYIKYKKKCLLVRQKAYNTAYSLFDSQPVSKISSIVGLSTSALYKLKRNFKDNIIVKPNVGIIIKYNEFVKLYKDLEDKISIPIQSITNIQPEPVYDFETQHSNHSFVANSFVTHNCPAETPEGQQCVTGDTDIVVGNYNRYIHELKDGDTVVTISPDDLKETQSRIKNSFNKIPDKLLEIKTISGRSIKCTPDHPFLVKTDGKHTWINAGNLKIKDQVVIRCDMWTEYIQYHHYQYGSVMKYSKFEKLYKDLDGKIALPVKSIVSIPPETVYDFETLHKNHSFVANGFVTHNCGLVKNTALTVYISIERGENVILEYIRKYISSIPTEQLTTPLLLNGKFMGWCAGESLRNFSVALRRRLIFYKDTSIVLDYDGYLYIYTDAARPTRPLLIIDLSNNELVIKNKNLWNANMKTLLEEGCVEYIDPFEQEYIQLAQTMEDIDIRNAEIEEALRNHQNALERLAELKRTQDDPDLIVNGITRDKINLDLTIQDAKEMISQAANTLRNLQEIPPYTHSELDPTAILGISASLIPLANHNQAPRNVYQCVPVSYGVLRSSAVRTQIGLLKDGDTIITIDPSSLKMSKTKIHSHFIVDSVKTNKKMMQITTHSGRVIQATHDHGFLTLNGWIEAGKLDITKHHLALYPSVKQLSDERSEDIIINIDVARVTLYQMGAKEITIHKRLGELENLGLLPLRMNHPHLPIFARMLGFTRADGHLGIEGYSIRTRMTFGRPYDAELFNRDVKTIGFDPNKIQERYDTFYNDDGTVKTTHHVWVIDKRGSFASFIAILGAVLGRKTEKPSNPIPDWIMNGSDHVKREYIAGFMGGDGGKIGLRKRQYKTKMGVCYGMSRIVQHKHKDHLNSSLMWFKQFISLLHYFKIETGQFKQTLAYEDKYKIELHISTTRDNLIRYMDTIGYRYATTKTSDSLKVVEWLKYVVKTLDKTKELRKRIHDLHYDDGYTHPRLSKIFNITVNQSQHYCKNYRKGSDVNLPTKSIKLEEWIKYVTAHNDCIFVPIEKIEEVEGCIVSDFTTESPTHSFVAGDGFITHNCGMGKQSLGIYHSQHSSRFDKTAKCLAYPSRPLFATQMNEILGLNELPAGDTVIVAIMTYTGYNQEDAIIMKQGAIDRGLFRQVVYKSYKSIQKRTRFTMDKFARPEMREGEPQEKYAAIDKNGIPRLGSFVREGDAIIGKVRNNITTGKVDNASTYIGVGQEGIVDKVLVATNSEGMRVVKVKIRQIRKPVIGDKYASRHAQKTTIGLILPDEDMPFSISGITPDIIINPHCIPSRMTMAKMIEIVASKFAALEGERINATAFRKFDIKAFKENLVQYGFSSSGKEKFFSGFTGAPFEALIFTGPCYYQVLRHHVEDKIQMRARGAIKQLSHQPTGGRARKGGQRVGEMERDAIISHGAAEFLRERLCTVSDAYTPVYCSTCGTIAIANHADIKFICRTCGDKAKFGTCTIPYAYKLLTHKLAGAGFNLTFEMSEINKQP